MSVYKRYSSGEAHLIAEAQPALKTIEVFPMTGSYQLVKSDFHNKATEEWITIFPNAAYFYGHDPVLFGNVFVMVYENPQTDRISTVSVTRFGVTAYTDLILDANSRFYPACENLVPAHLDSNVRRALAITNLKNYNKLINHSGEYNFNRRWDETNAGHLASKMALLIDKRPFEFGSKILEMGLIQSHFLDSFLVDIIYEAAPQDPAVTDNNNQLVSLLGDQLDQLFDPLLEYSPEALETTYNPPGPGAFITPILDSNETITAIVDELLAVQTNYTMGLVGLLQNFIIPLRVSVLAKPKANGISKINSIFPPTIDEITRINCVLHDSLSKAADYGYVEIIKVFGMILPYFYKPFIRHEANLKNFSSKLHGFHAKFKLAVFADPNLNRGTFTINSIDSVVSGSLLELPKLKLVLFRLHEAIMNQLANSSTDSQSKNEEVQAIKFYYASAVKVIDAFCGDDIPGQKQKDTKAELKQRIFTPTGRLLTELASRWPAELQYGWLSRKVIGIFELRNVKPLDENFYDAEILIIFSDHLLFLKITDDNYYLKGSGTTNLSIPDVLMHSLVNEKPLPKLSQFPEMEVSCWCAINDVAATTYKSYSSRTASEENFLRFLDLTGEGFKGQHSFEASKNFEIIRERNGNFATGNGVIELINKSKILFKSAPFHLFRSNANSLHIYSTAHTSETYNVENVKSPILILLHMSDDVIQHYFETDKNLFFIFCATLDGADHVSLKGFSRQGDVYPVERISKAEFQNTLTQKLEELVNSYFNEFSQLSEIVVGSTNNDLNYYVTQFRKFNSTDVRGKMKSRASKKSINSKTSTSDAKPGTEPVVQDNAAASAKRSGNARRKSLLGRLFSRRKSSAKNSPKEETAEDSKAELAVEQADENTPQRETTKYVGLYKPQPKLKRESSEIETDAQAVTDADGDLDLKKDRESYENLSRLEAKENNQIQSPEIPSTPQQETSDSETHRLETEDVKQPATAGRDLEQERHKKDPSLDVNSKFEFPTTHVAELAKVNDSPVQFSNHHYRDVLKIKPAQEQAPPPVMSPLSLQGAQDDDEDKPRRYVGGNYNMVRNVSENGFPIIPEGFVFDSDEEEPNWVAFSRDSSLADSEFQEARKYIVPQAEVSKQMSEIQHQKKNVDTLRNFIGRKPAAPALLSLKDARNMSQQSLTPSEYANNLAQEMDAKLSSQGPHGMKVSSTSAFSSVPSIFHYKPAAYNNPVKPARIDTSGDFISQHREEISPLEAKTPITYNTTSEEEFYSPDEFVDVDETLNVKSEQFVTYGSFSSDNTIINEMLEKDTTSKDQPPTKKSDDTTNTLMNLQYLGKFESIAYLSDYLDGNKEFKI